MKRPASPTSSRHAGRTALSAPLAAAAKPGSCKPRPGLGNAPAVATDFGDRRHDHAPFQAAADHLVLGGLSDGDPFQRHLGTATATPARSGLVQIGLAD